MGWVNKPRGHGMPMRRIVKRRRGPRQSMAIRPIPDQTADRDPSASRPRARVCKLAHQHPDCARSARFGEADDRRTKEVRSDDRRYVRSQQLDRATRRSGATSARAFRVATRQATSACVRCWDLRRSVRSSPAYTIACATLADENSITSGFTSWSKSRYAILMSS